MTLFDKSITSNLSQTSLLGASLLVETAIAMVLLSQVLPYRWNRPANLGVAALNTIAAIASLTVKVPAGYYAFFAGLEIATTIAIMVYASRWREPISSPAGLRGRPSSG